LSLNLNVLIVDDEPLGSARVKRLLQGDPDLHTIEVAENPETALHLLRESAPDILFLDIEMPGMNGFELLEKLRPGKTPYIIFVTAYEEHALHAFEVQAVDYLLKPVTRHRIAGALQRAKDLLRHPVSARTEFAKRLVVKESEEVHLIKTAEIDWIEANGRYVTLHSGSKTFTIREGISDLSARLDPARFARIHRSYVVNIDRIAKLQPLFHGEYRVILQDGTVLLLTRHYKKAIQQVLGDKSL
jgi:two-component system LytT family response regulator